MLSREPILLWVSADRRRETARSEERAASPNASKNDEGRPIFYFILVNGKCYVAIGKQFRPPNYQSYHVKNDV